MNGSSIKDVFENAAFDNLGNEKKNAIAAFIEEAKSMNFDDALMKLIEFYENMNFEPITENEKNAMISAVLSKMPNEERAKISSVLECIG